MNTQFVGIFLCAIRYDFFDFKSIHTWQGFLKATLLQSHQSADNMPIQAECFVLSIWH